MVTHTVIPTTNEDRSEEVELLAIVLILYNESIYSTPIIIVAAVV